VTNPAVYGGRLSTLLADLSPEARLNPGTWIAVQIRGVTIAVQVGHDHLRSVKISQDVRPKGVKQWDRWHETVTALKQHLGVSGWREMPWVEPSGVAILIQEGSTVE
jgi:hypothetical protein